MTDKEMAYPPGLSLHGNSWRITKRIPTELLPYYNGKKHLRLNTGKPDKREAASVAWQWHADQEAEFDRLRKTGLREKTSIAPADIQWLVRSMLASTLGAHEEGLLEGGAEEGRLSLEAFDSLREPSLVWDDPHRSLATPPTRVDVRGFRLVNDQQDIAHSETVRSLPPRFNFGRMLSARLRRSTPSGSFRTVRLIAPHVRLSA